MPNLDVLTLDGWHLDYYTGVALGYEMLVGDGGNPPLSDGDILTAVSRMTTVMRMGGRGAWSARVAGCNVFAEGPSLQVAVCRALVRAVLGATVPAIGTVVEADCGDLFA